MVGGEEPAEITVKPDEVMGDGELPWREEDWKAEIQSSWEAMISRTQ